MARYVEAYGCVGKLVQRLARRVPCTSLHPSEAVAVLRVLCALVCAMARHSARPLDDLVTAGCYDMLASIALSESDDGAKAGTGQGEVDNSMAGEAGEDGRGAPGGSSGAVELLGAMVLLKVGDLESTGEAEGRVRGMSGGSGEAIGQSRAAEGVTSLVMVSVGALDALVGCVEHARGRPVQAAVLRQLAEVLTSASCSLRRGEAYTRIQSAYSLQGERVRARGGSGDADHPEAGGFSRGLAHLIAGLDAGGAEEARAVMGLVEALTVQCGAWPLEEVHAIAELLGRAGPAAPRVEVCRALRRMVLHESRLREVLLQLQAPHALLAPVFAAADTRSTAMAAGAGADSAVTTRQPEEGGFEGEALETIAVLCHGHRECSHEVAEAGLSRLLQLVWDRHLHESVLGLLEELAASGSAEDAEAAVAGMCCELQRGRCTAAEEDAEANTEWKNLEIDLMFCLSRAIRRRAAVADAFLSCGGVTMALRMLENAGALPTEVRGRSTARHGAAAIRLLAESSVQSTRAYRAVWDEFGPRRLADVLEASCLLKHDGGCGGSAEGSSGAADALEALLGMLSGRGLLPASDCGVVFVGTSEATGDRAANSEGRFTTNVPRVCASASEAAAAAQRLWAKALLCAAEERWSAEAAVTLSLLLARRALPLQAAVPILTLMAAAAGGCPGAAADLAAAGVVPLLLAHLCSVRGCKSNCKGAEGDGDQKPGGTGSRVRDGDVIGSELGLVSHVVTALAAVGAADLDPRELRALLALAWVAPRGLRGALLQGLGAMMRSNRVSGGALLFSPRRDGPDRGVAGVQVPLAAGAAWPPSAGYTFASWIWIDDGDASAAGPASGDAWVPGVGRRVLPLLRLEAPAAGKRGDGRPSNGLDISLVREETGGWCVSVRTGTGEHSVVELRESAISARVWLHLAVVHAFHTVHASVVSLFLDGHLRTSAELRSGRSLAAPLFGSPLQSFTGRGKSRDDLSLRACLGTPPLAWDADRDFGAETDAGAGARAYGRGAEELRWQLKSSLLLEEPLGADALAGMARLGPSVEGSFQGGWVQWDVAEVAQTLCRWRVKDASAVREGGDGKAGAALGPPPRAPLLSLERVLFACRAVPPGARGSDDWDGGRGRAVSVAGLGEGTSGLSRVGASEGVLYGGARAVRLRAVADTLRSVGGVTALVSLAERVGQDASGDQSQCDSGAAEVAATEMADAVALLSEALWGSPANLDDMLRIKGYQALAATLQRQPHLLTPRVVQELLRLVGLSTDPGGGLGGPGAVANLDACKYLLLDHRMWLSAPPAGAVLAFGALRDALQPATSTRDALPGSDVPEVLALAVDNAAALRTSNFAALLCLLLRQPGVSDCVVQVPLPSLDPGTLA